MRLKQIFSPLSCINSLLSRRLITVSAMILVFAVTGCTQTVTTTFEWTATGDDSTSGMADYYDMRYTTDTTLDWVDWIMITGEPIPKTAGALETFTVQLPVESETTYYFALKAVDDAGNISRRSNIAERYIPDIIPPAMIINFRIPQ